MTLDDIAFWGRYPSSFLTVSGIVVTMPTYKKKVPTVLNHFFPGSLEGPMAVHSTLFPIQYGLCRHVSAPLWGPQCSHAPSAL